MYKNYFVTVCKLMYATRSRAKLISLGTKERAKLGLKTTVHKTRTEQIMV